MEQILKAFRTKDMVEAIDEASGVLKLPTEVITRLSRDISLESSLARPTHGVTELVGAVLADIGMHQESLHPVLAGGKRIMTRGGTDMLGHIFRQPTWDVNVLKKRQACISHVRTMKEELSSIIEPLSDPRSGIEADTLWSLQLHTLSTKDSWSLELVYPNYPILRLINRNKACIDTYHAYRMLLVPTMSIVSPVTTLFAPYLFMRRSLGVKIPLKTYVSYGGSLMWQTLQWHNLPIKMELLKYTVVIFYVLLFIYNIVITIDLSLLAYRMRKTVCDRGRSVETLILGARQLQKALQNTDQDHSLDGFLSPEEWATYQHSIDFMSTKKGFPLIYSVWKDKVTQSHLRNVCRFVYTVDAILSITCTEMRPVILRAYSGKGSGSVAARFYRMWHPCINAVNQVKNDYCFRRNLIVTGPNAAGKSTYARTALLNIVLSQCVGMCYADRSLLRPFHAISSFMRIQDTTGKESLFEAEVERCRESIEVVKRYEEKGLRSCHFLDEPLHSTPPLEGAATATAYVKMLAGLNSKVCVTTHYHSLSILEKEDPGRFRNVSMSAIPADRNSKGIPYTFPYKLLRGPEFQCIALELLPYDELVQSAIKYKNLFYQGGL